MTSTLLSVFDFDLNHHVNTNCAAIGKFIENGVDEVAVATPENKIILHDDINSIICYDISKNKTIFSRDMPEGVNCIEISNTLDSEKQVYIVCGCGSAIWGLDVNGEEKFWTTVGSTINCIAISDIDDDTFEELLVGNEDQDIKIFKKDMMVDEINEKDSVITLTAIDQGVFAFGLSSGIIGLFAEGRQMWRIKCKHPVVGFIRFPDEKCVTNVLSNGLIEIRYQDTGEVVTRHNCDRNVTNMFLAQLNAAETPQLTIVSSDGRIICFNYKSSLMSEHNRAQEIIRQFDTKRNTLLTELQLYENKSIEDVSHSIKILRETHLNVDLEITMHRGIEVIVDVDEDVEIRAVIFIAEGIFKGETVVSHPNKDFSNRVVVPIKYDGDVQVDLVIRVMIAFPNNDTHFQMMETVKSIPKFASLIYVKNEAAEQESNVEMQFVSSNFKLSEWFDYNFLAEVNTEDTPVKRFYSLRNKNYLVIKRDDDGYLHIHHNDIKLVGELVQSIAKYHDLRELKSVAYFPFEEEKMKQMAVEIEGAYEINNRMAAEFAQKISLAKECVIRGEDFIANHQYSSCKKVFNRANVMNQDLLAQHRIRVKTRQTLLNLFKSLNASIDLYSKLRVGHAASSLIVESRKAIADESLNLIPSILRHGL
uniref:Bardet-Biedl syndrome 2 protein homolog n=1 Tax=Rhabditophanes sp. KR3021 TaxID=114890 RepID=A0AC35U8P3_9BILA